jgi:hypothetical protein
MTYKLKSNIWLETTLKDAKRIAIAEKVTVEFEYGGIKFLVNENTDENRLAEKYRDVLLMGWVGQETIGPNCTARYKKDTRIELMTRRLCEAKMMKRVEQKHAKGVIKGISRRKEYELMRRKVIATSRNLLSVAEIDKVIKGYTRITCSITEASPYYSPWPLPCNVKISVITASTARTFDVRYEHDRRGFFIYLPPLCATSYTLKFSASGYVDMQIVDVKIREGKLNKIDVQMLPLPSQS